MQSNIQKPLITKKFAVNIIIILAFLNLAILAIFFYKAKTSADSLKTAATNSKTISIPGFSSEKELPGNDVEGRDLSEIERYSGSVRTRYTESPLSIEYQSKDSPEMVLNFFRSQLAKAGWEMLSASIEKVKFKKEEQTIEITTSFEEGLTTYTLTLK